MWRVPLGTWKFPSRNIHKALIPSYPRARRVLENSSACAPTRQIACTRVNSKQGFVVDVKKLTSKISMGKSKLGTPDYIAVALYFAAVLAAGLYVSV